MIAGIQKVVDKTVHRIVDEKVENRQIQVDRCWNDKQNNKRLQEVGAVKQGKVGCSQKHNRTVRLKDISKWKA